MLGITGLPIDASGLAKRSLESLGDLEDHTVREAWSQDRNRKWHSIASESSRTRNARQIQNIGKVCELKFLKDSKRIIVPSHVIHVIEWIPTTNHRRNYHRTLPSL